MRALLPGTWPWGRGQGREGDRGSCYPLGCGPVGNERDTGGNPELTFGVLSGRW